MIFFLPSPYSARFHLSEGSDIVSVIFKQMEVTNQLIRVATQYHNMEVGLSYLLKSYSVFGWSNSWEEFIFLRNLK